VYLNRQLAVLQERPLAARPKWNRPARVASYNWLHLRDGTGSEADSSNDILVTTSQTAKVSDVVTVKGIVRTDKDFGAGYVYKVLIEDATLQF